MVFLKKYLSFLPVIVSLSILMSLSGCGNLENFDADDFSLFNDEDDLKTVELRHYDDPEMSSAPLVEFIYEEGNSLSKSYESQVRKVCDYTKLPYRAVSIAKLNAAPGFAPTTRSVSVVETTKLSNQTIDKLVDFVAAGGTLFLPFANEDHRIAYLLGFRPDAEYATDINAKGYLFNVPLLPNMKGRTNGESAVHFGFTKENFSSRVRILATSINDPEFPLITENLVGKGKVIYYNTTDNFEKVDRGLLFSALLKGLEGIPYPIANTSTIFLDDFPSPLYDVKSEPVASEMDMTITDFVRKVWWPDMVTLAEKYKMSYSAMIAFDYKNKVLPPYIFDQWDAVKMKTNRKVEPVSDWLVRDVAKNGHELAFHGYNHVSLVRENWPNKEHIGPALQAVQKKWEVSNYGPMPITYVPPSNIIDKYGVNELKKGMPSLKYMCSLYLGEVEEGGGREFDFDPYNAGFFDYPRISSGFYLSDKIKYTHESMYLFTGIWTHFIHPDDIYQIDNPFNMSKGDYELRNGRNLGWRKTKGKNHGLFTEFSDYIAEIYKAFPQIRFLNGGDAGAIVNDWRASRFRHRSEDGKYIVEEANPDQSLTNKQYWFVYGSYANGGKIESHLKNDGAVFSKTPFMDGNLYMVFTKKPKLTLSDLQYNNRLNKVLAEKIKRKVQLDFRRFQINVQRFESGVTIGPTEEEEKILRSEIALLHSKMINEAKIDSVSWNKYAHYMNWEDRGDEVWKMLEEHCVKYPQKDNIMYSKELAKIVYYPNELSREKWLSAQLLVTPNDKDLLNSYVASYYTPENQEKIRKALVNLLKVDTSFETYLQFIQHLLTYDQPAVLIELKDKKPSADFAPVATDITWLYANSGDFAKAYEWSKFSDEIDFSSTMSWLIEMKDYKNLEREYAKYLQENPDDYKVKATMAALHHERGKFKESWVLSNSLPDSPEKDELRKMLNTDVIYVETTLQQDLLNNHVDLFYPEVRDQLIKTHRKEKGSFIAFDSGAESNKDDPQSWKNVLSYNFYDKSENLHSIAATHSTMYRSKLDIKDLDNVTHALGGLQYKFTSKSRDEKLQYWSKARVEYSDYERFYYHFGLGAHVARERVFQSAQLNIYPAETGPAHSKQIYRMQLNIYQDYYFLKYFNASLSLEGNYYTKSKTQTSAWIKESYEGSITTKFALDDGKERKYKIIPFIEGSLAQASIGQSNIDPTSSYPYWMIDSRLNGGGGVGFKYGLFADDFSGRAEAAYFFDDYTDEFQRYTGELSYQIFDFTQITASFEIYAQSKFYSNAVKFGVKHNLKPKRKKIRTE